MEILTLAVGRLQANCYISVDEKTSQAVIIDPGDDAEYISSQIIKKQLKPRLILATHAHFDHIMAAWELQTAFGIPFYLHKHDEFLLKRMRSSAKYFVGTEAGPLPIIDGYLSEGKSLKVGEFELQTILTPGHTPGGVSFYNLETKSLFVGDLLFQGGGLGRTDFIYSNPRDLVNSVDKIFLYPDNTVIYPGHGSQTTVGQEKDFQQIT